MRTLDTFCVIDDDPVFTFLIKRLVQKNNMATKSIFFGNGLDAINYLTENQSNAAALPQLILLDINMPILDGWQFLDAFKALKESLTGDVRIFMTSSSSEPEDRDRALASGVVSDFIPKPLVATDLQGLLERAISLLDD